MSTTAATANYVKPGVLRTPEECFANLAEFLKATAGAVRPVKPETPETSSKES